MSSYQMSGNRSDGAISGSPGFNVMGFGGPGSVGFCDKCVISLTIIAIS